MRAIRQFGHLMSSQVQVAALASKDSYGAPTYGTPVTYRAHLVRGGRLDPTMAGNEIVESVRVFLMGNPAIQATAQLTLSTADMGSTEDYERRPRILTVERRHDQRGPHHTVVIAGWHPRAV